IVNLLMAIIFVGWNILSSSAGINGNTVGSLSAEYFNLFTPAGYAFSIWGIIFLTQLGLAGFMMYRAFKPSASSDFISTLAPWLICTNFFTSLWVLVWLLEWTGASLIVMLIILVSLLMIVVKLDLNTAKMSVALRGWVSIPIQIYTGWITVATVANFSTYFAKLGWEGVPLNEIAWTIIMISIATLANLLMLHYRKVYAYGFVGIWSLGAIAVRHSGAYPSLYYTALAGMVLIGLMILWRFISGRLQKGALQAA
ncbi:MAG: tryptophan-rich sensory protein, partial [Bacteroidota bacterium]